MFINKAFTNRALNIFILVSIITFFQFIFMLLVLSFVVFFYFGVVAFSISPSQFGLRRQLGVMWCYNSASGRLPHSACDCRLYAHSSTKMQHDAALRFARF